MARLTTDQQREGLQVLLDLATERADDWEEYVNGPYGSTEYTEEDKRAYRERVMLARHTYAALLARLDASGEE